MATMLAKAFNKAKKWGKKHGPDIWGDITGQTAADKTNEFNQSEAEVNRNWQETQATTAFDRNTQSATTAWERTMEASNTSHQRQMDDMRAAGLNPILSAGGGGASSAASVAAQASSGGGSSATSGGNPDKMASVMAKASSALGIKGQETDNKTKDWQRKLTSQEVSKSYNATSLIKDQINTEKEKLKVTRNSAKNVELQNQTLSADLVEKLNRAALSGTDFGQVLQVIERLTGIVSPFKGK